MNWFRLGQIPTAHRRHSRRMSSADRRAAEAITRVLSVRQQHSDKETLMTVKFAANDKGTPPGKLADAELHFSGGPLDGLKLVGFAVWERRNGGRNVTFPARQYSVNGERRSYAILRPIEETAAQDSLREIVLAAYADFEQQLLSQAD